MFGDILGTRAGDAKDEFDEGESTDLAQHVRACTRRYKSVDRKLTFLVQLVVVVIVMNVLGVQGLSSALWKLLGAVP